MEVNDFTKQLEQVDWHEETDRKHPATLIPALETISNSFSFRPGTGGDCECEPECRI